MGTRRHFFVHREVARAFLGDPGSLEVNHKNGIKTDNRVDNLEYVTRQGNAIHAAENGLMNTARGESHYKSKLTEQDVKEIRQLYTGKDIGKLADRYGVAKTTIVRVGKRKGYKHVP